MATCEEQLMSSVEDLVLLQEEGLLFTVFKPVVAVRIARALDGGGVSAPHEAEAQAGSWALQI